MMMNVLIFDDYIGCKEIKMLIYKCDDRQYKINTVNTCEDLLEYVHAGGKVDILIARMYYVDEDNNIIEIIKEIIRLNNKVQIIYAGEKSEYNEQIYETLHVYYLEKPVIDTNLKRALDIAVKNIEENKRNVFVAKSKKRILVIDLNDIMYFESDKRKVRIICKNGTYEEYEKICDIIRDVGDEFIQCHRSYLINMKHIKEINKNYVVMENNVQIAISRSRYKVTREKYRRYIEEKE